MEDNTNPRKRRCNDIASVKRSNTVPNEEEDNETEEEETKKLDSSGVDVWGLCSGVEKLYFSIGNSGCNLEVPYKIVMTKKLFQLIKGKQYFSWIPYDHVEHTFNGDFKTISVEDFEFICKYGIECGRGIVDRILEHDDNYTYEDEEWDCKAWDEWHEKVCFVKKTIGEISTKKAETVTEEVTGAEVEAQTESQ